VQYPFRLPFTEPGGGLPIELPRSRIEQREFDISTDGVAHVGMLPDMMAEVLLEADEGREALMSGHPGADLGPVLRSADGFARAWRKAECEARTLVQGRPPANPCPR
jgi:hypothetical protein